MILKHLIRGFIIIRSTGNSKELFINFSNNFKESNFCFFYIIACSQIRFNKLVINCLYFTVPNACKK